MVGTMIRCLFCLVTIFCCTMPAHVFASDYFLSYVEKSITVDDAETVAIGDLNNDGRNDVAVTLSSWTSPRLYVYLQNAAGGLDSPVQYFSGSVWGDSLDIGDVNNDGRDDVVIGASDGFRVLLQNASGGLNSFVSYGTERARKLRIADLNNDGLRDVVTIGWAEKRVNVYLQNTSGTLNPPVIYSADYAGYNDLETGDVNNDGLIDIVVMSGQGLGPNLFVLLQNASGTFEAAVSYDLGNNELTNGVTVDDVNNDNLQDVIVSFGGNSPSAKIGVFLQNASGTLEPAIIHNSYDCPEPVISGDISCDARNDVMVAHGGWNRTGSYVQNSSGGLQPYQLDGIPYATHYDPHGMDLGDINNDGAPDIVLADYNHGLIILYNQNSCSVSYQLSANKIGTGTGTVFSNFGGIYCGSKCTDTYTSVTPVTLTAIPDPDSIFTGWSGGGCSGTGTCTVITNMAKNVTANFQLKVPGYDSSPADGATISMASNQWIDAIQTLSVNETGNAQLNVTGIAITGPDAAKFTANPLTFSIPDGGSAQNVAITCDGSSAGTFTATMAVTHNGNSSPATYTLNCSITPTGFTVTESAGNTTVSETGTVDTFSVVLTAQPVSNVIFSISSSDVGEASVSPATLTFTNGTWNIPQTVNVTGENDFEADGMQTSTTTISIVDASSDDAFDELTDKVVTVSTTDNDTLLNGWVDAAQTAANTDDDEMCWAAAASNLLQWGGWGTPLYNTAQDIFEKFQTHWTDAVGKMYTGWRWWFSGVAPTARETGAKVNVGGGGGNWKGYSYFDYLYMDNTTSIITTLQTAIQNQFGVTAGILNGTDSHALTVWGYESSGSSLVGLYVTDSKDGLTQLSYVPIVENASIWTIGGGAYQNWIIQEIDAFGQKDGVTSPGIFGSSGVSAGKNYADGNMTTTVPEPGMLLLFVSGFLGLFGCLRKKYSRR